MKEIELKLQLTDPAELERIKQFDFLRSLPHAAYDIETTYFDTSDLQLKKNGYALRIRRQQDQLIQTVKYSPAEADHALQKRDEWECGVNQATTPQFDAIPQEARQRIKDLVSRQQLIALFRTCFHRDTWLYEPDNIHQIEIALDCGRVLCQNSSLPILEIELELKNGQNETLLYSVADLLTQHFSLEPCSQSKAAKGYKLLIQQQQH